MSDKLTGFLIINVWTITLLKTHPWLLEKASEESLFKKWWATHTSIKLFPAKQSSHSPQSGACISLCTVCKEMKWRGTQAMRENLRSASSEGPRCMSLLAKTPRAVWGSSTQQLVTFTYVSPQMMLSSEVHHEWQVWTKEKFSGIMGGSDRSQQIAEPLRPDLSMWNSHLWVRVG